jgi:hypothetical protein
LKNYKLLKLQVVKMVSEHNIKLSKGWVDKMARWLIASPKTVSCQNGKLTKWQVDKMASWQNGKLGNS